MRKLLIACALTLSACGQSSAPPETSVAPPPALEESAESAPAIPEVDEAFRAAPASEFSAVEPSELGVQAAPTIHDALINLVATEGGQLSLSIRESGESAVADVVRTGLEDSSVSAAHIRVDFQREPEGWRPINAYRRLQCAQGGQWSASPCP